MTCFQFVLLLCSSPAVSACSSYGQCFRSKLSWGAAQPRCVFTFTPYHGIKVKDLLWQLRNESGIMFCIWKGYKCFDSISQILFYEMKIFFPGVRAWNKHTQNFRSGSLSQFPTWSPDFSYVMSGYKLFISFPRIMIYLGVFRRKLTWRCKAPFL